MHVERVKKRDVINFVLQSCSLAELFLELVSLFVLPKWKPELELKYRVSVLPTSLKKNTPANRLRHFLPLAGCWLVRRPDALKRSPRLELNPIVTPPSRTSIITWLATGIDYDQAICFTQNTTNTRLNYWPAARCTWRIPICWELESR